MAAADALQQCTASVLQHVLLPVLAQQSIVKQSSNGQAPVHYVVSVCLSEVLHAISMCRPVCTVCALLGPIV